MQPQDLARLVLLGAIWGSSFLFMRVLAPVLGPVLTADLRVSIAGLALIGYFRLARFDAQWRRFWKQYLIIGAINSALPFVLFSFAALHIPASQSAILNSSSPLFGALFGAAWLGERLTFVRLLGMVLGAVGVAMVADFDLVHSDPMSGWAMGACLLAASCYALAGTYMKRFAVAAKPMAIAGGSQLAAGILLTPLVSLGPAHGNVTVPVLAHVLGLALLCSAVAYLLYFRLVHDIGPAKALTVTFLVPLFGMLWGALFLGEVITLKMVAGCGLIILGTGLVLGKVSSMAR
jgi:drug/metabolite transporter (DMT)-like permease